MLREAVRRVTTGETLPREQARQVFTEALDGAVEPALLGAFLAALATRGETVDEITGAAQALRAAMLPFPHDRPEAVDTCGTGGDGLGMFNLSTAAAVVAAAAGAVVVKHGNRAASSRCGSADLLEAAGLPLELSAQQARVVLEAHGITFLFAPLYHPALRHAAAVRRALRIRTVFNWLGPLCNPGGVRRQLLGIGAAARVADFARVLAALGCERAYVVHGAGGADELTLDGANAVHAVGSAPPRRFDAAGLGLKTAPAAALCGGDAAANVRLLARVLDGGDGPLRDAVLLNAAAALVAAGVADESADALARARAAVDSGAARRKLESWVACAREVRT
ncbi:MAG: anthranilate phosphoribosyltransferase [Planctomycetota bacterium]|nr:MAG: anthranilate phosphoribosyltransferase [Planctomycetota bacterium]